MFLYNLPLWWMHNAFKTVLNVVILARLIRNPAQDSLFAVSAAYELLADPLALSSSHKHLDTSLLAHHLLVFVWAMAMVLTRAPPRTLAIGAVVAHRIVIYGNVAVRGFIKINHRRLKVTRAFLSMFQFVAAALDGLIMMGSAATVGHMPLQMAIAMSQFGVVTSLGAYHLRLAAKRYGVLLVDMDDDDTPTLIPIWVP